MTSLINLDKPAGMSSAAAVGRVKRLLPRGVKIGHAGTLDPFATGVLLLLIGSATKSAERFMSEPKQYEATICLGATTPTLDPDSEVTLVPVEAPPTQGFVEKALADFVGEISQMPPDYSALKIAGQPAYALMRRGEPVKLQPRNVTVYGIELLDYEWPSVRLRVDCGRGTYIRALARDLGERLGTAGYLTALRRTRIGRFSVNDAVTLDQLTKGNLGQCLHDI